MMRKASKTLKKLRKKKKDRIKVVTLGDDPRAPSGVGTQSQYVFKALMETGDFDIVSLGGAPKHQDYTPHKIEDFDGEWKIIPVEGYGNKDQVRSIIHQEKPDILWFMTDPRYYDWLWSIENEIRTNVPMVYYHVWDNYPVPDFNKVWYDSNDAIVSISKVTEDIVEQVADDHVKKSYIPHAVPPEIFRKMQDEELKEFKDQLPDELLNDKFIFFWNNRNARRKQSGSLIFWFKKFLDDVGHDKASLIMHTDPYDQNGPNLVSIIQKLGLTDNQVIFSQQKLPPQYLAAFYNLADCTINVSDAEGFGLCLDPETNIQTKDGIKFLKDVNVGNEVLGEDGYYHEVLKKAKTFNNTYEINCQGTENIVCSGNHPFFALKRERRNFRDFEKAVVEGSNIAEWTPAENLTENHYIAVTKQKYKKSINDKIDLLDWISDLEGLEYDDDHVWLKMGYTPYSEGMSIKDIQEKFNVTKWYAENARRILLDMPLRDQREPTKEMLDLCEEIKKEDILLNEVGVKLNRFININDKFLEFLGWYLAEGSNGSRNKIEIDLHEKEIHVAKKFARYFKKEYGITNVAVEQHKPNSSRMRICSTILSSFFENLCGKGAKNKKLHSDFANSVENVAPILRGYFMGDGCNLNNSCSATTISKQLAWQVKNILAANNIHASISGKIYPNSGFKSTNKVYCVRVTGRDHEKFCKFINVEYKNNQKRNRGTEVVHTDDYIYVPVKNIKRNNEKQELVDIQVKNSKSFTANGLLVHNSTLESMNCGTPVIVNKTGGLQDQAINDKGEELGVVMEPDAKAVIGSQTVPYIYEDRLSEETVVDALKTMYNMPAEERDELGEKAIAHMKKNFNFDDFKNQWVRIMKDVHKEFGSWPNKNYNRWEVIKIEKEEA